MAKIQKITESYSLSYSSREDSSNDTLMDVNVSFDNPLDDAVLIKRLNTWLKAIGRPNIEVRPVALQKE